MEIKIIGTSSELATFLSELAMNQRSIIDGIKLTTEKINDEQPKEIPAKPKAIAKKTKARSKKTAIIDNETDSKIKVIDKDNITVNDKSYVSIKSLSKKLCVTTSAIYYYKKTNKVQFEIVSGITYFNEEEFEKIANKIASRGKRVRQNHYNKPIEQTPFSKWKTEIHNICRKSDRDEGKLLSEAYKKLTNVYGVVYAQLRKDFYRVNGYSSKSTLEMVYWLQTNDKNYKGLLESILEDMVANA